MEKANYRDTIAHLNELFPNREAISAEEAAKVLNCDVRTVRSNMKRTKNPIPSKQLSERRVVIPIVAFARWLA